MSELKFSPDYKEWKHKFDTEPVYTRRQMTEATERAVNSHRVNRVIQHINGDQTRQVAMQILAIHNTPEGVIVIVK